MTRPDVREFDLVPSELKTLYQWECWKRIDGRKIPVDVHSGRPAYGPGFGVSFDEAVAYFESHPDVLGLFLRFRPSDDSDAMIHAAQVAGCRFTHQFVEGYTPSTHRKQVHR